MKYDWNDIKERCRRYVLHCPKELPEGYVDKLINDVYCHILIDEQRKKAAHKEHEEKR